MSNLSNSTVAVVVPQNIVTCSTRFICNLNFIHSPQYRLIKLIVIGGLFNQTLLLYGLFASLKRREKVNKENLQKSARQGRGQLTDEMNLTHATSSGNFNTNRIINNSSEVKGSSAS